MRELTLHESISISGGAPATPVVAPAPVVVKKEAHLSDYLHELTPWVIAAGAAYVGGKTAYNLAADKGFAVAKDAMAGLAAIASFVPAHFMGQGVNFLIK